MTAEAKPNNKTARFLFNLNHEKSWNARIDAKVALSPKLIVVAAVRRLV